MTIAEIVRWFFFGALAALFILFVGIAVAISITVDECEKAGGRAHLDDWLQPHCIMPKE